MKKTSKSALYSTIKNTVKKLGISTEDTTGIINYIKFMESNAAITPATNIAKSNNKKVSPTEVILSVLNESPNKPFSIQDIAEATSYNYTKVQVSLRSLKASRKIKIVSYIPGCSGPSKVLYQTWRSPLKALKLVTEKQGYTTVNGFIKNNKKLLIKNSCLTSFALMVEEANLTSYPLSLNIGIAKGYKNTDLKNLISNNNNKKTNKSKRKYTRKAKVQPVEVQVNQEVQNKQLNLFSFFRKKKNNSSDLIEF